MGVSPKAASHRSGLGMRLSVAASLTARISRLKNLRTDCMRALPQHEGDDQPLHGLIIEDPLKGQTGSKNAIDYQRAHCEG